MPLKSSVRRIEVQISNLTRGAHGSIGFRLWVRLSLDLIPSSGETIRTIAPHFEWMIESWLLDLDKF